MLLQVGFWVEGALDNIQDVVLNLSIGHVDYVNAGHNPPILRMGDDVLYLKSKKDMVLGGMEDSSYRMQQLQLAPGKILFLYTVGSQKRKWNR